MKSVLEETIKSRRKEEGVVTLFFLSSSLPLLTRLSIFSPAMLIYSRGRPSFLPSLYTCGLYGKQQQELDITHEKDRLLFFFFLGIVVWSTFTNALAA